MGKVDTDCFKGVLVAAGGLAGSLGIGIVDSDALEDSPAKLPSERRSRRELYTAACVDLKDFSGVAASSLWPGEDLAQNGLK